MTSLLNIKLNPDVKCRVWVLDDQKTFKGYYEKYGDEIAERYENGDVIILPNISLDCDLEFLQNVKLPSETKKFGTANGIDRDIMIRRGNIVGWNPTHPLGMYQAPSDHKLYLYHQIVEINSQLRIGVRQLFPRYFRLFDGNITWRFTPTRDEPMHLDGYFHLTKGRLLNRAHVKFFINMDSAPRIWRVSHGLKHIVSNCFDPRLEGLPSTLNDLNLHVCHSNILGEFPYHHIEWPQLSLILADGESVTHQVLYGNRAIGGDFIVPEQDLLDARGSTERRLTDWLQTREKNKAYLSTQA